MFKKYCILFTASLFAQIASAEMPAAATNTNPTMMTSPPNAQPATDNAHDIKSTTANGETQTTIIDQAGNLKIVNKPTDTAANTANGAATNVMQGSATPGAGATAATTMQMNQAAPANTTVMTPDSTVPMQNPASSMPMNSTTPSTTVNP